MIPITIHATIFAAGALIGGSLMAIVVGSRKRYVPPPIVATSSSNTSKSTTPVVEVSPRGTAQISKATSITTFTSPVLKYGNPGPIADLLTRKAYVTAYDRRLRHPAWTAEHLTVTSLGRSPDQPVSDSLPVDRSKSAFVEDDSIPAPFRSKLRDYFRSGYDRGHMAPAADAKSSQAAMDETFLLTNIAPQTGVGFNQHYWAYLEDWCRRLARRFTDVYIFTVPLYLPRLETDGKWRVTHEVIGSPPNVSVPTHFAKVILASKPSSPATPEILELSLGAFVLPNATIPDETPLESFIVPVETVEHAAGLILFSDVVKSTSRHICKTTSCQLIIRRFDDARKRSENRRFT